jgi:hypothetical protein
MTFDEIVAKAESTRHEVYGLVVGVKTSKKGRKIEQVSFASAPVVKDEVSASEELQQLRTEKRRQRAIQLENLIARIGLDRCESENVTIAALLPPPVHVQECDGEMPLQLCLIAGIEE